MTHRPYHPSSEANFTALVDKMEPNLCSQVPKFGEKPGSREVVGVAAGVSHMCAQILVIYLVMCIYYAPLPYIKKCNILYSSLKLFILFLLIRRV